MRLPAAVRSFAAPARPQPAALRALHCLVTYLRVQDRKREGVANAAIPRTVGAGAPGDRARTAQQLRALKAGRSPRTDGRPIHRRPHPIRSATRRDSAPCRPGPGPPPDAACGGLLKPTIAPRMSFSLPRVSPGELSRPLLCSTPPSPCENRTGLLHSQMFVIFSPCQSVRPKCRRLLSERRECTHWMSCT